MVNSTLVNDKFKYLTGVAYSIKHRNPLRIKDKKVVNNLILVHSYIISKVRYDLEFDKYVCKLTYSELIDYTGLSKKQIENVMRKLKEYEVIIKLYTATSKNESSLYAYML